MNVINNAVDSFDNSGIITVTVRERLKGSSVGSSEEFKEYAEIIIADNGCGIRTEDIEKIFSPFFSTKESNGTGLGLSISKTIIQRHKGKIEVESEVNKGTKFKIILPKNQE